MLKFPVIGSFMYRKYDLNPSGKELIIHFFKISIWIILFKLWKGENYDM